NDLALSDLRLLPALQQYDAEHGTKFAERARMLIWMFAASFVGVDGESTLDEESALDQFRQALDGHTAWTLLDLQPDNLAVLKQRLTMLNTLLRPLSFKLVCNPVN